jgi:PPK2 family polyphosphate:nucleotide phosphotransferase
LVDVARFRVAPGKGVDLDEWPTRIKPLYATKKDYERLLAAGTKRLSELQRLLYAHDRYSLLVVFQAMDAAGKDGAIRHVMSGVNPQGCQVFSFKHPSAAELDHDFLWRTYQALPERGRIGIFNRSYYEEVLIVRVRPEILGSQKLPDPARRDKAIWQGRYRSIVDSEAHLHRNGTRIVKFFLHLSKAEQCKRFVARIDDPDKNWKFSRADVEQRAAWDDYMKAYAACFEATSTREAPWYVVPADDKKTARLIVSQVLVDTLEGLSLRYPETTAAWRRELQEVRRELVREQGRE